MTLSDVQTLNVKTLSCCDNQNQSIHAVAQGGCCGGLATEDQNSCCALEERIKAEGGEGCGCSSTST